MFVAVSPSPQKLTPQQKIGNTSEIVDICLWDLFIKVVNAEYLSMFREDCPEAHVIRAKRVLITENPKLFD